MPWSTGRMETYPVPPRRPWSNIQPRLRKHGRTAVALGEDAAQVVGTREGEVLGGKRLGGVAQEGVRVLAEERVEIGARAHARQPTGGSARAHGGETCRVACRVGPRVRASHAIGWVGRITNFGNSATPDATRPDLARTLEWSDPESTTS